MTPEEVEKRWPWLNTSGVPLASYGLFDGYLIEGGYIGDRNEGWFDPWLLVRCIRNKAHTFGANYVVGELEGFTYFQALTCTHFQDRPLRAPLHAPKLREALVRTPAGELETIAFHLVVNCAGAWSGDVLNMGMSEVEEEVLPLPLERR